MGRQYNKIDHDSLSNDKKNELETFMNSKLKSEFFWKAFMYLNAQLKNPVLEFNPRVGRWQDKKRFDYTERENSREIEEKWWEEEMRQYKERQRILD